MHIIVGLGNPGEKYSRTRHNAGFLFVEKMSEYLGWDTYYDVDEWTSEEGSPFLERHARADGSVKVLFIKPMTFMNLSGSAVRQVLQRENVVPSSGLILAHDDLDVEMGKFKLQRGVSPKNHRGVRSVEQALVKSDFFRVRIGVDNRGGDRSVDPESYVLLPLSDDEYTLLDQAIDDAIKHLRSVVQL
jgi:peptidyl-tRNA hydrolase, PTH1 family